MTKLQQAHAQAPVWTHDYQRQTDVLGPIAYQDDSDVGVPPIVVGLLSFLATITCRLLLAA